MMTDPEKSNHETRQIDTIYQILIFEIENANNQLTLFQKDNVNFILLMLALIGFFAFIPLDIFLYNWFGSAIFMWILCSGIGVILSIAIYWTFIKSEKSPFNKQFNNQCNACDSSIICDNVVNLSEKNNLKKIREGILAENIDLFFSAFHYLGMIFLVTAIAAYFYLSTYDPGHNASPLIQPDPLITIGLILSFLIYAVSRQKREELHQENSIGKYLAYQMAFSGIILIIGFFFEAYGHLLKIPTFISVSNTSQFSIVLIQHSFSVSSFQISLLVFLYTVVIFIVLFDYFLSSKHFEKTNRKLIELMYLKNRIDRYQLGLTPSIDIGQIQKDVLNLKTIPPQYFPFLEIIKVPIPFSFENCEDTLHYMLGGSQSDEARKKK